MLNRRFLEKECLAKISILSDKEFIGQAQSFVLSYAKYFNFSKKELLQIELIVEEALLSTISNAFSGDLLDTIDILIRYRPGKFIIAIEDKGLPVDIKMLESADNSYMSIMLLKNIADEFMFSNLGRSGKRLELIKYISDVSILEELAKAESSETVEAVSPEEDAPIIRLLSPDEVTLLSRLAFKSYGYTYISIFYYPDKIKELLEAGLLVSAVSVNKSGEIVGTLSLVFDKAGDKVADSGAAMVDPRYRGHNLFKNMKIHLRDYAIQTGMYGLYSEAVTIHSFTQMGNNSLGARETGIMLAFIAESITFKKISKEQDAQRQSVVLYYLKTNQEPHRRVYMNSKFADIIRKIYANVELDREIIEVGADNMLAPSTESTIYTAIVKSDLNIAYIRIETIGADAFGIIAAQLRQFCLKKIETIYLEFPMSEPYTAELMDRANEIGFMFSGIVPEFNNGDVMKMQYLNNVIIDPSQINLSGELSKEILTIIMQDYK